MIIAVICATQGAHIIAMSPPPLVRKYLEPEAKPTEYVKATGRALINTATAILRHKALAATAAAALATALSLYYIYTHPDETAQMVEKVGLPLAGTAAAIFAERMMPSGRQPQPYPTPAVARRPVPQPEPAPVSAAETQSAFKQAFQETGLKNRLERERFEQWRQQARKEELARRLQEKKQAQEFEQIWQETQPKPRISGQRRARG